MLETVGKSRVQSQSDAVGRTLGSKSARTNWDGKINDYAITPNTAMTNVIELRTSRLVLR
jgi:hypothetical protein